MRIICNLRRSQLTYSSCNMRIIAYIGILFLSASALKAQDAADPHAIDLTNLFQVIDTSNPGYNCYPNLNIGDIDGDGYEDMVFGRTSDSIDSYDVIHYGGAKIFSKSSDSAIHLLADAAADFNGDGKTDLISHSKIFYKNSGTYPYFKFISIAGLWSNSFAATSASTIGVTDWEEDGVPCIIAEIGDFHNGDPRTFLALYNKNSNFDTTFILPVDSMLLPKSVSAIIGKFSKHRKPMILCRNGNDLGIIRHELPLSKDTIIWISSIDSNGVTPKKIYSMDITGDGVTDLLVSDGLNIYVYPGNDNFGLYRLTKDNAYYIIKSPAQMDLDFTLMKDFGGYMRNCGNLIGDGTPLLMVTGTVHNDFGDYVTYSFFYSGGKALDTYYDAIYREYRQTNFTLDTLHSIDNTGRTAVVFQSGAASSTNWLLYDGAQDIPRTPNPNLKSVRAIADSKTRIQSFPSIANKYIRIDIESIHSSGELRIYNLLGVLIETRKTSGLTREEIINTSAYSDGIYITEFQNQNGVTKTKFIIRH
jgi:hypothetical protein